LISWSDSHAWGTEVAEAVGETLAVDERLVVSPCEGRFRLAAPQHYTAEGEYVVEGQVIGHVFGMNGDPVPVESLFGGWVMKVLLPDGAPVRASEPVLWLRSL
jgi:biotin carboxyl carrier protein